MQHQFKAFVDDLRSTHGDNLASVILYGSAAAGDFVAKQSDYNILIALKKIGPADLRKAHASVREWVKMGHPLPVYFTVSELKNAADVFPIEFHQMNIARRVLFGPDLLADIEITNKNLRLQTEYELRSKLLQLRRQYIPASASIDNLKWLMSESLTSFAVLFRAVLVLYGIDPPATKREVVAMAATHLNINGAPFEKIFNIREDNFSENLDEIGCNALFGEYMDEIENVINAVDSIEK
jgi:predicted nucleotidyltransferase